MSDCFLVVLSSTYDDSESPDLLPVGRGQAHVAPIVVQVVDSKSWISWRSPGREGEM